MEKIKASAMRDILGQLVDYIKEHPHVLEMETKELTRYLKKELLTVARDKPSIGIIFHFGLYSVPAFDSDPSRRGIKNGSEWYLKRLTETASYRPISGWKETQAYHEEHYGERDYFNFKEDIKITEDKVEMWIQQALAIKAKYVIITTKHHDGCCLFPRKEGVSLDQDVVGWVAKHARKNGLKFGAYYSWLEWGRSFTKVYMEEVVEPQINELQKKYKPDLWFFDGQWMAKSKVVKDKMIAICKKLKKLNPQVEMNDRGTEGEATFKTLEKTLPEENVEGKWEYIDTIGHSWGYNAHAKKSSYKTGKQLYDVYEKVTQGNGNFVINLGPTSNGSLDKNETRALREFAQLLKE